MYRGKTSRLVFTSTQMLTWGGCPDTQRSTTGVFLCMRGTGTMFPLVAISKRQSCVSVSTPEAELVAGSHGLERELIPALDMGDKVLPLGMMPSVMKTTRL